MPPSKAPACFQFPSDQFLKAQNGGLFVSRHPGLHPKRVIDSWELIFIRNGSLAIRENDRHFKVHAGEYLILQPGQQHEGTEPYTDPLSFYWLHFEVPKVQRGPKAISLNLHQQGKPRRPDRFTELFHQFIDDQNHQELTVMSANCLIMLMLNEAANTWPKDLVEPLADYNLAIRADRFITANANTPISTTHVAESINCNPDYLGQIFRHTFGMTITQAITRQRLVDARKQLLNSELNIDQIAMSCGFQTTGHFRRVFRKSEGMSPKHYRALHLRKRIYKR